ncbi:MAG: peptidoglycan-binding protein [Lachnospiraceae bacterium]|nr:peptidoglycan-binding protein [Lachnospiraceae bacterium]
MDSNTNTSTGQLRVNVTSILGSRPISQATIRISYTGNPNQTIEELTTNILGQTDTISLPAPPESYSQEPSAQQPFSEYNLEISAPGFETVEIIGLDIFPNSTSIQNIQLLPMNDALGNSAESFVIPENTLFGDFPPKIAESEVKSVSETGEIVLSRVVIPEYIIVHDGPPSDNTAQNYYVKYKDYIKNVASSEIYATWPEATIIANILAIQSFTLNRIYTEWYRNKGYNFNITTSTAYDQKWVNNRNIFQRISEIVDSIFDQYLARPNITQPILTQYCDGNRVSCPNWLSQWGSKTLGDQGYSASEIIRYYYGDNMYIAQAEEISGIPSSWPGKNLTIGSTGSKVAQLQNQLNVISRGYPLIPKIVEDGVFGQSTANAVKIFQGIFDLPETGIVDFPTWYKISEIFVGVSRIAELV